MKKNFFFFYFSATKEISNIYLEWAPIDRLNKTSLEHYCQNNMINKFTIQVCHIFVKEISSKALLFKMWNHLGTWWKCRFLCPAPNLQNQNLRFMNADSQKILMLNLLERDTVLKKKMHFRIHNLMYIIWCTSNITQLISKVFLESFWNEYLFLNLWLKAKSAQHQFI